MQVKAKYTNVPVQHDLLYTHKYARQFWNIQKNKNINEIGITSKVTTTCVQLSHSKNTCFTTGEVSAPSEIRPISKSKVA